MKTQNEILNELNQISPFLSKIEKKEEIKNGVTPQYFDKLQDRVIHQVYELDALKPKVVVRENNSFSSFFSFLFSPKTSFALMFFIGLFFVGSFYLNSDKVNLNALSVVEMDAYFNQNSEEIDDNLIASVVSKDDINVMYDDKTLELEQFVDEEDMEI